MAEATRVFTGDEGLMASLQHLALLKAKRDRLNEAKLATEEQIVAAAARLWKTNALTYQHLVTLHMHYRSIADQRFSKRWDKVHPIKSANMHQSMRMMPNGDESWHGSFPLEPNAPAPGGSVSVVYVLFDSDGVVCDVGSSHRFRKRLKQHARAGKAFVSWQAFPANDRTSAYELEKKFLRAYKPYLNKVGGAA